MNKKKLWKDSNKDSNGWAYESDVAKDFMKAMLSLAVELYDKECNSEIYEKFFNDTTDKIKELLN